LVISILLFSFGGREPFPDTDKTHTKRTRHSSLIFETQSECCDSISGEEKEDGFGCKASFALQTKFIQGHRMRRIRMEWR